MNFTILLLLAVIASILQTVFVSLNWMLILVLNQALVGEPKDVAWFAFAAGLIFDLFAGFPLGLSGTIFLFISLAVFLLRRSFPIPAAFIISILAILADFCFSFLAFRQVSFSKSLIFTLVFLPVYFFLKRFAVKKKGPKL